MENFISIIGNGSLIGGPRTKMPVKKSNPVVGMEMSLSPVNSYVKLIIPEPPNKLDVKEAAATVSHNIINKGEFKFPRGYSPKGYSWSGILPGVWEEEKNEKPDVPPKGKWILQNGLLKQLLGWQKKGTILTFVVSGLGISSDVFIESLNYSYSGGKRDINYTITLTLYRPLTMRVRSSQTVDNGKGTVKLNNAKGKLSVYEAPSTASKKKGSLVNKTKVTILEKSGAWYKISHEKLKGWVHSNKITVSKPPSIGGSSSSKSGKSTYIVKRGDSLWSIAKAELGSGKRYTEIYKLNEKTIKDGQKGKKVDKHTIYPGQRLKLPSR